MCLADWQGMVFDLGAFAVQNALQGKHGSEMGKVLFRLTLQGRLVQGRVAHLGYPVVEPGRESYSGWPAETVCVRRL